MISCIESRTGKSIEAESRLVVSKDQWRVTANWYGVSFRADENILELDSCDGCTYNEHTKNH